MSPMAAVRIEGRQVILEPMAAGDGAALFAAADDSGLFRYLPDVLRSRSDHDAWVERGLADQAQGRALPYTIRLRESGEVVGTTRLGAIEIAHRRAEIGWTWIARKVQRTAVNTECKRLLLGYGFDTLDLNRVELKTDFLNQKSRTAIARIGATQEGIFRGHMVMPDGRVRDTVYFSILRSEWPAIRERLDGWLAGLRA